MWERAVKQVSSVELAADVSESWVSMCVAVGVAGHVSWREHVVQYLTRRTILPFMEVVLYDYGVLDHFASLAAIASNLRLLHLAQTLDVVESCFSGTGVL